MNVANALCWASIKSCSLGGQYEATVASIVPLARWVLRPQRCRLGVPQFKSWILWISNRLLKFQVQNLKAASTKCSLTRKTWSAELRTLGRVDDFSNDGQQRLLKETHQGKSTTMITTSMQAFRHKARADPPPL
eukprot:1480184-Amphidinium_carterae.1